MSEIEWDETKRQSNLRKHGLDLLDGELLFDGRPIFTDDARSDVEQRFKTIGMVNGLLRTLIWTWRDERRRFISFRSARDEEKRKYRQLHQ